MKYDNQVLANIVDSEGLEYTICNYLDPENIIHPEIREKAIALRTLVSEIYALLPDSEDD